MRTSFTVAPDVADQLRERVEKSGKSMAAVINELLRDALSEGPAQKREPFRVKPFNLGLREGIDPLRPSRQLYEMDLEEFEAKNR